MTGFTLQDATIESVQHGYRSGALTARRLVELYLARIAAYDRAGPKLNAIMNLNPEALAEADALDARLRETGLLVGPLHGVPVLVKDQIETSGTVTTFGSVAFNDYQPERDATVIRLLRDAGAIILAKTVLPDFACSWFAQSSTGRVTRNPYALDRDPGGSSCGTAAGIAANLGLVGIGGDTGGSVRVPAAFCNLIGVRVTTGLISRTGISQVLMSQDTAGPLARTVRDAALLLDVLVGYDADDPLTERTVGHLPAGGYVATLAENALSGARIGVLRELFGPDADPDCRRVSDVCELALGQMSRAGAMVIDPVTIPELAGLAARSSLYLLQCRSDLDSFIRSRTGAAVASLDEIYATKRYHPALDFLDAIEGSPADPADDPTYRQRIAARDEFQVAVTTMLNEHRLDAIVFPDVQVPAPLRSDVQSGRWTTSNFPTNTMVASQATLPAISMPAGFTPEGLAVGLEIVGRPYDEAKLLGLAYSFEQAGSHRAVPLSAPRLSDEP